MIDVVILKLAEELPADTVTDAGTVADVMSLESFTTSPPAGAVPLRTTVPVEFDPPVTVDGLSLIATSVEGFTVILAV